MKIAMTSDEGGKTMIKKLTLVFVVVSLLAAPAVLAGNGAFQGNYGELFASAFNSDAGLNMEMSTYASIYGDLMCQIFLYDEDGNIGFCFGENDAFSVNVSTSLKYGTFEANTEDLDCFYEGQEPPPSWWRALMISVKCTPNGTYSGQSTINSKGSFEGGSKFVYHSIYRWEEADCAITTDGILFGEGNGTITYNQGVEK